MRRMCVCKVACMAVLLATVGQVQAAIITGNGNPLTAIPDGTQIDFNSAPIATVNSLSIGGVTIRGFRGLQERPLRIGDQYAGDYNTTGRYVDNNQGWTPTLVFNFGSLVDSFAFNIGAVDWSWTLGAYAQDGSLIESYSVPLTRGNDGRYVGIRANGISRAALTLQSETIDFITVDNLTFSEQSAVPEPASLAIWSVLVLQRHFFGTTLRCFASHVLRCDWVACLLRWR